MKDNLNKTYKPTREDMGDYYAIEPRTTHSLVAKYLVDATDDVVYSKPAEGIAKAINLLWSSLNGLDLWRMKYVAKHMPEVFKLAQLYSDVYGSPCVSLIQYMEEDQDIGPNHLEKLKSYRTNPPSKFKKEEV